MQKLNLSQGLQQKLSPQQIQFIKLLQVPTAELENRIEEELELNPVLEEGEDSDQGDTNEEETVPDNDEQNSEGDEATADSEEQISSSDDIDINDYLRDDDYNSYKTQTEGDGEDEDDREMPVPMGTSLHETLMTQLGFLGLNERQEPWSGRERARGMEVSTKPFPEGRPPHTRSRSWLGRPTTCLVPASKRISFRWH